MDLFDMVGYFVKMLWNIGRLKCSSRFERKTSNILLKTLQPSPKFNLTFSIFGSLADKLLWPRCNSDSQIEGKLSLSKWHDSRILSSSNLSAHRLLWLCSCCHLAPHSKSGNEVSCLFPPTLCIQGSHAQIHISVLGTIGVLGVKQSWQTIPAFTESISSAFYPRETKGSQ